MRASVQAHPSTNYVEGWGTPYFRFNKEEQILSRTTSLGFGCGFDFCPFAVGQSYVGGLYVFFEVLDGGRAGDGEDNRGVLEEPRQG